MTTNEKTALNLIGGTLREARLAASMKLPDLAEAAGISKGHLSGIEHGKMNISISTLYRVCLALEIHPRYVLPDFRELPPPWPKEAGRKFSAASRELDRGENRIFVKVLSKIQQAMLDKVAAAGAAAPARRLSSSGLGKAVTRCRP